jgi:serine/threonine-protein kinase HipA
VVGKRADQIDIHELKLAMALRGRRAHYKIIQIQARHFRALADEYPDAKAWPTMIDLAHRVEGAIKAVEQRLPNGSPQGCGTYLPAAAQAGRSPFSLTRWAPPLHRLNS